MAAQATGMTGASDPRNMQKTANDGPPQEGGGGSLTFIFGTCD